jgi:protein involved in polysaccharide export with SLBB domain
MLLDKRTTRSQIFKQFQVQQQQHISTKSEGLPLFHSDFSMVNPALANIYEVNSGNYLRISVFASDKFTNFIPGAQRSNSD